jgi:hypothetical protein
MTTNPSLFSAMKACAYCGEIKPLDMFHKHKQTSDGLRTHCKQCRSQELKRYHAKLKEDAEKYEAWKKRMALQHQAIKNDPVRLDKQRTKCREYRRKHQALHGKKPFEYNAHSALKWQAANKEKMQAHKAVRMAIRGGLLTKQPCEMCGCDAVHAHHDDYSRPLDVRWLCPTHHGEVHVEIRRRQLFQGVN